MFIKNSLTPQEGDNHMKKIENSECQISFGNFIRKARERKGLLQAEVAAEVGIPQSYYSIIENGAKSRRVDLATAMRICQVLGLDISDFTKMYT